ncbi:MaoC family dehydratase [Kutzneria viridogrisea]|uniref:MaoC-like dehydratase n=2 Tax=Kutzneria TaxID=43356 RepID=W5W480_9PSEU|nr:MaoC family dehydratase [Kutzneria albida]AHH95595.1 MaoC-like dehydratase [Kutzneria albida DSM 43870]MBA8927043.1 acyl dehydratase [Kutzneria viridogrisea]
MRVFADLDEVKAAVGQDLGTTDWHTFTQEQVNLFADATEDHQWIHVDLERAKEGPFGGPIAHGYLTLSMMPKMSSQLWKVEGLKMGVNYGLNKVRFPSPVLVGSRVRGHGVLREVADAPGGLQATIVVTLEIEGQDKPACVAECLVRLVV